jgi:hypothetical protein
MAWFLMHNQSRFLFSHDYGYVPFAALLKRSIPSHIIGVGTNAFVLNQMDDYIYHPEQLEDLNWYEFVACYDVVHLSEKNKNVIMHFSSTDHQLFESRGMIKWKQMVTPLVSYHDFLCASEFQGNIMSPSVIPNSAMEKFAHMALCLFVPFHDKEMFKSIQGTCFTDKLRATVYANAKSSISIVHLQNIQNCHNVMKAGQQKDILEQIMDALPEPSKTKANDHDEATQKELEYHIEMCLTELFADMDEDHNFRNPNKPMSLYHMRK